MKTSLTKVNSATNGTLKQKRNHLVSKVLRIVSSAFIAFSALTIMSFTQDDTTRMAEDKSTTSNTQLTADSCCTVTYVRGLQNVVIINRNAFTADIRINNMDIQSWLNSLKAYSFKHINVQSLNTADQQMDVAFTKAELMNRKLAAGFSKRIFANAQTADEELNDLFLRSIASVQYSKSLIAEVQNADNQIDQSFMNDAELNALAVQYKRSLKTEKEIADAEMDFMMQLNNLKNFMPITGINSDREMDLMMINDSRINKIPVSIIEADANMDELFQNSTKNFSYKVDLDLRADFYRPFFMLSFA